MDTINQALSNLTRLRDQYHLIPPPCKPTKELLTPGGEHHGGVDEEGLVMTTTTNPPLQSPKRTLDQP